MHPTLFPLCNRFLLQLHVPTFLSFSSGKVSPGEQWTMAYKSPIKTNSYEFKSVLNLSKRTLIFQLKMHSSKWQLQAWHSIWAAGSNRKDGRGKLVCFPTQPDLGSSNMTCIDPAQQTCQAHLLPLNLTRYTLIFQNLVTVEGKESLIMWNDTKNVDEAGKMKRTLSFSPEGITEVTVQKLTATYSQNDMPHRGSRIILLRHFSDPLHSEAGRHLQKVLHKKWKINCGQVAIYALS